MFQVEPHGCSCHQGAGSRKRATVYRVTSLRLCSSSPPPPCGDACAATRAAASTVEQGALRIHLLGGCEDRHAWAWVNPAPTGTPQVHPHHPTRRRGGTFG
jgi:hypothetical protein